MTLLRRTLLNVICGAVTLMATPVLLADSSQESSAARPFHFSSVGSAFAVQGEFSGQYSIQGNHLLLNVTYAVVSMHKHPNIVAPRQLTGLQFALAHEIKVKHSTWDFASRGDLAPLNINMPPDSVIDLGAFQTCIEIKPGMQLPEHWLVAQMNVTTGVGDKATKGFCYAHSSRTTFSAD